MSTVKYGGREGHPNPNPNIVGRCPNIVGLSRTSSADARTCRPMPEHRRPIPNSVGLSRTASADARTSSACPEQRRPMPKHRRPIPNVGRTRTQEHKSIKPHPLPPTRHVPIGRCICLVPRPCLTVVTCCCAPRVNRLRVLTWNERGRILKDSCRGMAWLHQNVPPLIHQDIKS